MHVRLVCWSIGAFGVLGSHKQHMAVNVELTQLCGLMGEKSPQPFNSDYVVAVSSMVMYYLRAINGRFFNLLKS